MSKQNTTRSTSKSNYGNPITKDLKKKYSSRLVGGVEMRSQGGEAMMWWWCGRGSPTLSCGRQKPGGTHGEQAIPAPGQTAQPRVPAPGR